MTWDEDDDYAGFDSSEPDDDATLPCPACGAEIDDAERCPKCGHYPSRADQPPAKTPAWIIVGAIVCIVIVVLWVVSCS